MHEISEQLEARKTWIAALRSGKYTQAKGRLEENGKFCCLGVACDLFAERVGLTVDTYDSASHNLKGLKRYDMSCYELPAKIVELLGLFSNNGKFYSDDTSQLFLTDLNDKGNKSFAEIADIIENNPSLWRDA